MKFYIKFSLLGQVKLCCSAIEYTSIPHVIFCSHLYSLYWIGICGLVIKMILITP